jgi:hypothetical protein
MDLEFYWYEISPFGYTVAGGFFLGRADAGLPIMSAILLLTAGGTILFLRRSHALRMRQLVDVSSARERLAVRPSSAKG